VDVLRAVWASPERYRARAYGATGETYTREKGIYYDTDGIQEQQQETVRLCDDCPGWLRIESRARGGEFGRRRIWAMCIPWAACERCAEEGRSQYHITARRSAEAYDWIYLQDRPADRYLRWDPARGHETEA
jgi:hypothetical protein